MICVFINKKQPFQKISAIFVSEVDNVKKFAEITTAVIERDFKSEFFLRTRSVATNLMTSLEFHSDLSYYAVPFLPNNGVPYSLLLTPIAVL